MSDFDGRINQFDRAQLILLVYKDKKKIHCISKILCTTIHFVCNKKCHYTILKFIRELYVMAIRVVEFSNGGYKIRKVFS
jgi:hypothetical protein